MLVSKGLKQCYHKKLADGWYHPVAYASWSLNAYGCNYHSMKQEFLALKWAIAEKFQEYLLWESFIVKTVNNPLTYIITKPNLDATWHQWLESLAQFLFSIKYQKWHDNVATDTLSFVALKLNAETVKSILDGVAMGTTERAGGGLSWQKYTKPSPETVILVQAAHVNLYVTDWVTTQQKDPTLKAMIEWISDQKVWDLKHLLGDAANTEEGKTILQGQKKLTLYWGALYHHHTPTGKLEEVLWFVVPKAHWAAGMNGCHHDAGYQCQEQTLCLQNDWFQWPGMAVQMQRTVNSCKQCVQHQGICAKAPVQLIIDTTPLELLLADFTTIETMMELDQPQ